MNSRSIELEQLNLLAIAFGTKNESQRRSFARLGFVFLKPPQVKFHLPLVSRLEPAKLEFHGNQAPELSMKEE